MKIGIKGVIIDDSEQWIYDMYSLSATSPKKIQKALDRAKGKDVEVEINSTGGSVFAGSEIYTALSSFKGKVTINIVGTACSAAAVIAASPNAKCYISPTASIMWHRTSTSGAGNLEDIEKVKNMLTAGDTQVASAFCKKTGKSMDEAILVMSKETWYGAKEAVEIGLCDGIMFEDKPNLDKSQKIEITNSLQFARVTNVIPREIINQMQKQKAVENSKKFKFLYNKLKLMED